MARAIWTGAVSFGLVNVPVKVYAAVRDHKVHFHQLDRATGSRIRYEKVAEKTGKSVTADQLELGYEIDRGKLVVVDPAELVELRPKTTRTIDISDFVELSEIDPAYYERTYWLAPDGEPAVRPYRLLVAAMEDRGRAGIGMVVMRNKQYLAAIRPRDGALAMSTMRFADEVIARKDIDGLPGHSSKQDTKAVRLATQIIDSLATAWRPERYRDTYTNEVRRLIRAHEKHQEVVVEEAPAARVETADLMEALEASLASTKSRKDRDKVLREAAARLAPEAEGEGAGSRERDDSQRGRRTPRRRSGASRPTSSAKRGGRPRKQVPRKSSSARKQSSGRKSA